ncbi:UNVERIFIED_CONTAM: group II intron reverse transcriptase/maturase [Acetivibrio alkalicellulosi]
MNFISNVARYDNLVMAWNKIRKKHVASGIDNMTVNDFQINAKDNLKELQEAITSGSYEPKPIRCIAVNFGEKQRTIGLMCLCDKIVQQAVLNVIMPVFEPIFSSSSYAYRKGRSAKLALDKVLDFIKDDFNWILESDIKDYFDSINHEVLEEMLYKKLDNLDAVNFIMKLVKTPTINDSSFKPEENMTGLCLGGVLSPFLSNIYLNDFDHLIENKTVKYIRYSDDFIVLSKDEETIKQLLDEIRDILKPLRLELKEEKTLITNITTGFDFLGYYFDSSGRRTPGKAREALKEKLEEVWINKELDNNIKLDKVKDIIVGWEQYYDWEMETPCNIIHYIFELNRAILNNNEERFEELKKTRWGYCCNDKDSIAILTSIWQKKGQFSMALLEYERYNEIKINDDYIKNISDKNEIKLLSAWEEFHFKGIEAIDKLDEIAQIYTDNKLFLHANHVFNIKLSLMEDVKNELQNNVLTKLPDEKGYEDKINFQLDNKQLIKYCDLFICRDELYAIESLDCNGVRVYETKYQPITEELVKDSLKESFKLTTYIQRANNTVKFLMLDIDVCKKNIN